MREGRGGNLIADTQLANTKVTVVCVLHHQSNIGSGVEMRRRDDGAVVHATIVGKHVEEEALAGSGERLGGGKMLGGDDWWGRVRGRGVKVERGCCGQCFARRKRRWKHG